MSRSPRTKPTPLHRRAQRPNRAPLALLATALSLAISASPALAATAAPTLIAPTASSVHNSPLSVEYELPEAGAAGATLAFIPATGPTVTVTLTSPASAAGKHHFFLNLHELEDETANVAKASAPSVPDGEYTVTFSYQNAALEPFAGASAEKVTIKTVTGVPTVSEPTAGQSFRGEAFKVAYKLPEAALPGSVKLLLFGSKAGPKPLLLSNSAAGSHTAEVVPSNPSTGLGIASAQTERLPTDSYQLSISYQDALGNPAASTVPVTVNVAYPLCEPGTYSASGEEPCVKAPKGYFVASKGAIVADECIAGRFAPAEGFVECIPAVPGHYVPGTGAKEELECEQGTYSDEIGRSSCTSAPAGHYAPKGSVMPTACPAGTFDAHTNSPSAEFCEPCPPGTDATAGASSCTPVSSEPSGGGSSQTGVATTPGTKTPTPSPISIAPPVGPRATFAIAAKPHGASLARTRRQLYTVTCSVATTVQLRVGALVQAGKKRLALTARTLTLKCKAAKATAAAASFKLTPAAKKLLGRRGASVKLTVSVYATGAAAGTRLAGATLRGKP